MGVPNPETIAPGEEAGYQGQDTPYAGAAEHEEHVGLMSLNEAFSIGVQTGRM